MSEIEEIINRINLARHNSKPANRNYECNICKDTGWISEKDENGYEYAKKCECYAIKEAKQLLERSGISLEFQQKGFKNFDTRGNQQLENALNKSVQYFQTFEKTESTRYNSILFYGQVGAGKTHLGTAICSNLMTRGIAVVYMPYRNAVTKIKQMLTDEINYDRELTKYRNARVLYIDDLLKGKVTESDINIMYEIVNYRYMNNLPLIISTEKSLDELLNFDEAIGSRIIEMCRGNIVQFKGKELNYRLNS